MRTWRVNEVEDKDGQLNLEIEGPSLNNPLETFRVIELEPLLDALEALRTRNDYFDRQVIENLLIEHERIKI